MEMWEWIVVVVAIVAVLALAAAFIRIRQRRTHLKERFGPEYQRAVSDHGIAGAESHLSDVEGERESLDLRDLPSAARDRYLDEWRQAETHDHRRPAARVLGDDDRVLAEQWKR